jgi:glycosyltransferase involved in cell wall biosynthesis
MKALVFTSLFPNNVWPNHGVFVKERMRHVAKLDGCQLKVVAPVPYFPPIKVNRRWRFSQVRRHEVIEGLEVYHPRYLMVPKIGMALHGAMMFLSTLSTVKKLHTKFDFDLIDAHYVYPDGFAAVLLSRVFRKPVVVSARGSDINLFANFLLIRKLLQYTLNQADGVIAVSRALREAMVRLGVPEEKITVVPNGVDLEKFHPFPREEARKLLGLPHKRVILSVGGLVARKRFDLLIQAFNLLSTEFHEHDLYLAIVGEGACRRELEALISALDLGQQVHLAGNIPHHELYLWYSAADLFCLASSREGWPNVLLESLACGTPVVATNVWGIPEVIPSDHLGLLTRPSAREIAQTIALALKRPWQPGTLRQYAGEHTWDRAACSVLRVFEALLEKGNAISHTASIRKRFTPIP